MVICILMHSCGLFSFSFLAKSSNNIRDIIIANYFKIGNAYISSMEQFIIIKHKQKLYISYVYICKAALSFPLHDMRWRIWRNWYMDWLLLNLIMFTVTITYDQISSKCMQFHKNGIISAFYWNKNFWNISIDITKRLLFKYSP